MTEGYLTASDHIFQGLIPGCLILHMLSWGGGGKNGGVYLAQQGSGLGSFPSLSAVLLQGERKPPSTAVLILLHSKMNVLNLNNSSHFSPM